MRAKPDKSGELVFVRVFLTISLTEKGFFAKLNLLGKAYDYWRMYI